MAVTELPPWLQPLQRQLLQAMESSRLPQAWLIHGVAGLGKRQWAERARQRLLCRQGNACGQCPSCHLLDSGAHPDSYTVEPDGPWIKIEAIRGLIHWAGLSAQQGERKVCLIAQAQRMNAASANALLKTLEEPPGQTLFLLLADELQTIPATIRSRCRLENLPMPTRKQARDWLLSRHEQPEAVEQALALARGNPGLAAQWLEADQLPALRLFVQRVCELWQQPARLPQAVEAGCALDMRQTLELCWYIASECIKMVSGATPASAALPSGLEVRGIRPEALFALQKQAYRARAMLGGGIHEQGLLTDWLLNWIKAGRRT